MNDCLLTGTQLMYDLISFTHVFPNHVIQIMQLVSKLDKVG